MNARPYIFGCLCLVGATGTAAAADIDLTGGLLSMSGAATSSFEGSSGRSQGGSSHDSAAGGDVMSTRASNSSSRSGSGGSSSSNASSDNDDSNREGPAPIRAPAPSWQSMLPGSML